MNTVTFADGACEARDTEIARNPHQPKAASVEELQFLLGAAKWAVSTRKDQLSQETVKERFEWLNGSMD